jgi:hypothetical protein
MSYASSPTVALTDGRVLTGGLHVVREQRADKPFNHFALLDLGGVLRLTDRDRTRAVIVEMSAPRLRFRYFDTTPHVWDVLSQVADEVGAAIRWEEALRTQAYDLFLNNCEHLVNFIAVGKKESPQVGTGLKIVVGVAAAIALIAVANREAA